MTAPARPPGIPTTARFEPDEEENYRWVEGALDDQGREHGPYRSWADAGYLHSECTYVNGVVDGPNRVFHPDGSLASIGEWKLGTPMDATFYRAETESPEPFAAEAGPSVWSVRYCSRDGVVNHAIRFFDRDGVEVCLNGDAIPPRPAGVHADAGFLPQQGRWILGSVKRATNARTGTFKSWSEDGVLRKHEELDEEGRSISSRDYRPDGTLKREQEFSDGEIRCDTRFHDNGKPSRRDERDDRGRETHGARWNEEGDVTEEKRATWEGDRLASFSERDEYGLVCEAELRGDVLACRLYGRGVLVAEGQVAAGRIAGVWKSFDPSGAVRASGDLSEYAVESGFEQDPDSGGLWRAARSAFAEHLVPAVEAPELDGVDRIEWDAVETCHGTAEGFPFFLRAMASAEPLVRDFGASGIWGQIEHQGSVYAATAAVAPFLIRLLANENVSRHQVLEMLHDVGGAAAPYADRAAAIPDEGEGDEGTEDEDDDEEANEAEGDEASEDEDGEDEDDEDDEDDGDGERTWARAILGTLEAIGAGLPDLFALLETSSAEEKRLIIGLAGLARGGADIRDRLLVLTRSPDPSLRAMAIHAGSQSAALGREDLVASLDDPDPIVRTVAALTAARRFGPESPEGTFARLREAFEQRDALYEDFSALPFVEEHLLSHVALAIGRLRTPEAFALAPALCREIDAVDGVSATSFAAGLLRLAFGRCEKPFMPGFLDVLDALAASRAFYAFNVNASEQLRAFGIQTSISPEALAGLVVRLRAAADPEDALHAIMHGRAENEG